MRKDAITSHSQDCIPLPGDDSHLNDPNRFFSPIQIVLLSVFPDIEEMLTMKLAEGYTLLETQYKANEAKSWECLNLLLGKNDDTYRIKQKKEGHDSFSQVVFEIA